MTTIEWVLLTKDAVKAGDLVSADAGGMPIYRVIAIENGRAWLQCEGRPALQTAPLDRFYWRAAAAH